MWFRHDPITLLFRKKNIFHKYQDNLKKHLKNDCKYAQMWLDSLLELKYTICEFANIIGIHKITLYKIFTGLGYNKKVVLLFET